MISLFLHVDPSRFASRYKPPEMSAETQLKSYPSVCLILCTSTPIAARNEEIAYTLERKKTQGKWRPIVREVYTRELHTTASASNTSNGITEQSRESSMCSSALTDGDVRQHRPRTLSKESVQVDRGDGVSVCSALSM